MCLLHPADIFCDTRTVFLNIAHLVHHLRQVRVVRIRAVFFHQVGFGEFDRQSARIAHHDTIAENRHLHATSAIVVAVDDSIHDGLEDNRARNLKYNLGLNLSVPLSITNRQFRHHPTGGLADLLRHIALESFVILNRFYRLSAEEPRTFDHGGREIVLRVVGKHKQCPVAGLALSQQTQMLEHRFRLRVFGQRKPALLSGLMQKVLDFIGIDIRNGSIVAGLFIKTQGLYNAFVFEVGV